MTTDAQQFAAWQALVTEPGSIRSSAQIQPLNLPTPLAVARRARQIWQEYQRPDNRDDEIWAEAERQLALGATENNLQP